MVVVVVLVLANNNKIAEADPSTLFCWLSFDSFENVTTGTDCYIIAGLNEWHTSVAARSCPTMVPHVKTAVVGI